MKDYFLLLGEPEFVPITNSGIEFRKFHMKRVELLDKLKAHQPQRHAELMEYYNGILFPENHDTRTGQHNEDVLDEDERELMDLIMGGEENAAESNIGGE